MTGYVRLVDTMGADLTVVNTARVSFDKESSALSLADEKLIEYIVKHGHNSCLRHCVMTFEIYAPMMVKNQWIKHMVASAHVEDQNGWNESSRRYVTENEVFYVPEHFLAAPANKKQGAGEPVDEWTNDIYRLALTRFQEQGVELYKQAIADGIAPEEARLFLPAYGLYIRWRWTASLNAILNFLDLRLDKHAQSQIRAYATAVEQEVSQAFPITYKAWKNK